MSEELKPCPFCGGKAEMWHAHPENPKRSAWIACMARCGVLTKEFETNEEAAATWNTRAAIAAMPDLTDRVRRLEEFEVAFRIRVWNECKAKGMRDDDCYQRIKEEVEKVEARTALGEPQC